MFKRNKISSSAFCTLFYNQPETAVYRVLSLCEIRSLITPSQVSCGSWHVPPVATAYHVACATNCDRWHKHEPLLLVGSHSVKAVATRYTTMGPRTAIWTKVEDSGGWGPPPFPVCAPSWRLGSCHVVPILDLLRTCDSICIALLSFL